MNEKYKGFMKIIFTAFLTFLLITGCEKKEEKVEFQHPDTINTNKSDTTVKQMSEIKKDTIQDLRGDWKGTFDQRSATMTIIKQDGKEFTGTMSINYREPLNKTISGTFDPSNNSIKMEDVNASKYLGEYSAQLLENGKLIQGTFDLKAGGNSYRFKFNKK